ncbi:MAG TPA: putative porin [Flavobacterium sp.]|jgi:hypothetical protein
MRLLLLLIFVFLSSGSYAQDEQPVKPEGRKDPNAAVAVAPKATIELYKIISIQRDTTHVDTSLTIQDEYEFNYLRRDIFGLLPFANEGQPYNTLYFGLSRKSAYPDFGYSAKHFFYMDAEDINYYSVATPFTDLYFKSVMEQGQNLDAFITLNTSPQLNFSVAYKGLRSLGKYINQLSSTGNFRFTTSYSTPNKRYIANIHFVAQDALNGENGGIVSTEDFESDDPSFKNRARLEVFLQDAESFLKAHRTFIDHHFRINREDGANNLYLSHRFSYEYKFFEYRQPTIASTITNSDGTSTTFNRFGNSYVNSRIHDRARYNRMYNLLGATYENETLGSFTFFAEDYRYNYFFNKILILSSGTIPNALSDEINSVGADYKYNKGRWHIGGGFTTAVTGQQMSDIRANASFRLNDRNNISISYNNTSRIPDHIFNLHQSSYVAYNWRNVFENEKINKLEATINTQWANASFQLQTINNFLYFSNNGTEPTQLISPQQYSGTINYMSVKLNREFRYWKLALDNTLLYQQTTQDADILNVPQFVTRNTLYFSNHYFKRALYIQTGVTLNYFTKYYANGYSPVLGEFFVQNQREIGNFPMLDFFINARIRQTRIFLKAEHFNSAWTGNDFYSAPDYPYRDFVVRFGLVWNFFQ